jgi:hypothetical protein
MAVERVLIVNEGWQTGVVSPAQCFPELPGFALSARFARLNKRSNQQMQDGS